VLADEDTLGLELAKSLTDEQKKSAVIADKAPEEIITKEEKRANPLQPAGISADKFNDAQRGILAKLIAEYAGRYRREISLAALAAWTAAGWEKVSFAWAGGFEPGIGHYYRIQSPDFVIEFDNIQNNARHPHAVWRDFDSDFGEDLLKKHYQEAHAK
jgi:hypothetical protein